MGFYDTEASITTRPHEQKPAYPRSSFVGSGYRSYSPVLARWVRRDHVKMRRKGLYLYVLNSPIRGYDMLGLEETLPEYGEEPNIAPCEFGGYDFVANVSEPSSEGRVTAGMYVPTENPSPGLDKPKSCCVCGKKGFKWSLKEAKCSIKFLFQENYDPHSVTRTTTGWGHEAKHAMMYANSFKARVELYEKNAECLPAECDIHRTRYLAAMDWYYQRKQDYDDVMWNAVDYPGGIAMRRALLYTAEFSYRPAMDEKLQEAMQHLAKMTLCIVRSCTTPVGL